MYKKNTFFPLLSSGPDLNPQKRQYCSRKVRRNVRIRASNDKPLGFSCVSNSVSAKKNFFFFLYDKLNVYLKRTCHLS